LLIDILQLRINLLNNLTNALVLPVAWTSSDLLRRHLVIVYVVFAVSVDIYVTFVEHAFLGSVGRKKGEGGVSFNLTI
jgi:hypothetical protein